MAWRSIAWATVAYSSRGGAIKLITASALNLLVAFVERLGFNALKARVGAAAQ